VAPGDFRTIAGKVFVYGDQSFVSQPFLFGKKGFNDAGQITFRADFGDDSSAVVVASSANGLATRLTTGSPVELAQDIPVPDWPATLIFDYQFQSSRGTLSVLLGDETLAQLTADDGPVGHFERTIDLSGLGLSGDTVLKLVFDDTTSGSVLVIDNIDFPGLENGDFEQGLLYFTTTGEGTASLVDVGEATRETLASTCPCDNDSGANWKNRGKYISCVGKISDSMVLLGLLGETEQDELVSEASHSSCGR
jgi:hypothetical protein